MQATQHRISKWLFYLILFPAVLGICGWQGWQWWSWVSAPVASNPSLAATATDRTVQLKIPAGTSAQQIGEDLAAVGLIRSATAWNMWTRWRSLIDRDGGFQAGTYELSLGESLDAIASKIWRGEIIEQSFTIPEGWSLRDMGSYFEQRGFFSANDFLSATQQIPRDRFPWLPEQLTSLEGLLYPDTYAFTGDSNPNAVIDQMLSRFEQVALPIYQAQQSQTPYTFLEWVTLASIVEKEAAIASERPLIASVFAKRLREGIALGADPTVEYALGIRQTQEQPLTYAQIGTPSPYNTYVNPGLPPGPIASPGIASLEASLRPDDTEYLYFVARYDGSHVFSRTLAEHEAAQASIRDQISPPP